MCELCDPVNVRKYATNKAETYDRMAAIYRSVAAGYFKPHTEEFSKATRGLANSILQDIVNGWSIG